MEEKEKFIKLLESTTNFINREAPEYVQELLKSATIKAGFNIIFFSICLLLCFLFHLFCIYKTKQYEKSYDIPVLIQFGSFFPFIFYFIFGGFIFEQIQQLITIKFSPKIFIINHIKHLFLTK